MPRVYWREEQIKEMFPKYDWIVDVEPDYIKVRAVKWVDSLHKPVSVEHNVTIAYMVASKEWLPGEDLEYKYMLELGMRCMQEIELFVGQLLKDIPTVDELKSQDNTPMLGGDRKITAP